MSKSVFPVWDYDYHKETLANGLTMVQVHQPHLHSASIAVLVRTGSRFESPGLNGVSHFLEHMLFRGTPRYPTAFDLNVGFEDLGGTLGGATAPDSTEYAISLPEESILRGIEILHEVMSVPLFTEIDTERKIIAEEIREDLDEEERPVDIDFLSRRRMWPANPLGQSVTGSLDNIKRFTLAEIDQWFREKYVAQNMVVCVAGALRDPEIARTVRRLFGGIRRGEIRQSVFPIEARESGSVEHVNKPGSQTQVRLGFHAPGVFDADFTDAEILLRVIDDGMSTPLHRRIFENRGLAYNVSASFEAYEDVGAFNIDAACSHENVSALVEEALDIVGEIREKGVSEESLVRARARTCWGLRDFQDSPGAMTAWFGAQELIRPARRLEEVVEQVQRVDVKRIRAMADRIFHNRELFVTTVGVQSDKQRAKVEAAVRRFV